MIILSNLSHIINQEKAKIRRIFLTKIKQINIFDTDTLQSGSGLAKSDRHPPGSGHF